MNLPILSLIVAFLAVCVSLFALALSLKVSNKQIVAPMRQAWINKLRELLAEFTSRAAHHYYTDLDNFTAEVGQRLSLLKTHIQLMLNSNEKDHKDLEALMGEIVGKVLSEKRGQSEFEDLRTKMIALSREILKREWDRVKKPMLAKKSRPQR